MVAPGIQYRCPTCKKEVVVLKHEDLPSRPFCCTRCKMVDLYKWLNEEIVISESTRPENDFLNKNIPLDEEEDQG
jgi:endogenous inhibitor of DNA gyrase (YacG/DUF329 family)